MKKLTLNLNDDEYNYLHIRASAAVRSLLIKTKRNQPNTGLNCWLKILKEITKASKQSSKA